MRSKSVNLKIPHRLYEAYEKLAPRCGYENVSQLLVWNPAYALMVDARHSLTAEIAKSSPETQDAMIEQLVSAFERGDFTHGSYFEKTLRDVVDKFKLPVDAEIVKTLVADAARKPRQKRIKQKT